MTELTHDEVRELLAVYALDAVDPDERDLIEGHLAGCPQCRAEVAGHRETAAMLASAGATAPDGLWDRIAASLEEAPPELRLAPVVPMGRAAPQRQPLPLVAAAAVAAVVIGLLGFQLVRQDRRIDDLGRGQLAEALRDPDSTNVHLTSSDERKFVDVVIDEAGVAHLVTHNLDALPDDRTYQVWAIVGDEKVSLGLLGNEPVRTSTFRVSPGAEAIALTAEAAGGVDQSANPPVVVGSV